MRRWNGWGDTTTNYPLPENAGEFLSERVGPGTPPQDAALAGVVATVPESQLPDHPLLKTDPAERLRHARGQSLPDWVALRSGRIPAFPDAVAHPVTAAEVRELIQFSQEVGAQLIPYGGGTSVVGHINVGHINVGHINVGHKNVGHINPAGDGPPVLTVNLQRLNRLLRFDPTNQLATFGAGVMGPDLEAQLRARGHTLGHFPQSFEFSTLGGWVATRSSGQQSLGYGRIEDLFAGGSMTTPQGTLDMPPFPASAAGPDLRQLVLGSEGRLGIITEATVRVTPLPEREDFHAVFFPDFESGQTAVRTIVQARLPLSMMRLSTAVETTTTLALAGHERLIALLEQMLYLRGISEGKCLLMMGFTGSSDQVKQTRSAALSITGTYGGIHVGRQFGRQWHNGRFRTPYLRNSLWEAGYAVDTLETATNWSNVPIMINAIETAIHNALAPFDEKAHVFTHLSHVYRQGASIYTTYLFRQGPGADETLARWQAMKTAASQAIVAHKGTISHQHGVGSDHAPYLAAEKGELGLAALNALCKQFDPEGVMNPGKLIS
jgi:alkyldihydroxyacetonephosphate synthase